MKNRMKKILIILIAICIIPITSFAETGEKQEDGKTIFEILAERAEENAEIEGEKREEEKDFIQGVGDFIREETERKIEAEEDESGSGGGVGGSHRGSGGESSSSSSEDEAPGSIVDEVFSDGKSFLGKADPVSTVINEEKLKDLSSDIYNILLAIGMVIAVIVGSILGIQFMISSVEEKAKIKEILIVYGVGCFVLFGGFTIWKIVVQILGTTA